MSDNRIIEFGSPAYKSVLARVKYLGNKAFTEGLTRAEHRELKRKHARIDAARLAYELAKVRAHT